MTEPRSVQTIRKTSSGIEHNLFGTVPLDADGVYESIESVSAAFLAGAPLKTPSGRSTTIGWVLSSYPGLRAIDVRWRGLVYEIALPESTNVPVPDPGPPPPVEDASVDSGEESTEESDESEGLDDTAVSQETKGCPTCGASGDNPCVTKSGNVSKKRHAARD